MVTTTTERRLWYVLGNGQAVQYGVGVGRPGFTWGGSHSVTMKREWPDWRPPASMLKRRPDLPRYMKGGPDNPLGARALYLGSSLYRIHGTNDAKSIGKAASSGCFRMLNGHVVDLSSRVKVGTVVTVVHSLPPELERTVSAQVVPTRDIPERVAAPRDNGYARPQQARRRAPDWPPRARPFWDDDD